MTDDARKHSRRLPRKRARALALAGLLATATIACDGSLGSTQNEPDPNVRGTFSGYFVWAKADPAVAIPPLEPAVADEAVRRAADSIAPARDPRFGISIVATYENGEAAAEQAVAVRKILADSAAWYADRANDSALAQLELELINGEVDPEVLARLLDTNALSDPAVRQAWARDLGERMGRLPVEASSYGEQPLPDDYARLATSGTVRLQDGRLEMGWLSFGRLAAGLPSLAGYLTARGCGDIRIRLVDFDQVRKD